MQFKEITSLTAENLLSPELQEILEYGKNIRRFTGDDLPKDVVIDNVYQHTLRCFQIALGLDIDADEKEALCKILLIHDLPEIESLRRLGLTADLTTPEKKANPERAREVALLETAVASEIFTPENMALYEEFEEAANYLKHGRGEIPSIGALAKLIDFVDPNLVLHGALSSWALSDNYSEDMLASGRSLSYAVFNNPVFAFRFSQVEDETIRAVGLNLLDYHLFKIREFWDVVFNTKHLVPAELDEEL
jgi:hypothetical protein